jgi:uncharacterized membrane protein YdbT with pleckstrin-like domain
MNQKQPISAQECHSNNIVIFRSPLSEFWGFCATAAVTVLSIYLSGVFPWSIQEISIALTGSNQFSLAVPLFALLPLTMLMQVIHNIYDYRFILCDDYILEVRGLWSLFRKSVRINYVHVRGIEIDESFLQQLFGHGDVAILGVADQGHPAIIMRGIAKPRAVKDLIQSRVNAQLHNLNASTASN